MPMGPEDLPPILVMLACVGAGAWWLVARPQSPRPPPRISARDPLLEAARARARETLPVFRRLAKAHPTKAMVKLRVDHPDGEYHGQWADVLTIRGPDVHVVVRGRGEQQQVQLEAVEDWQVEVPGGRWRGAYTVVAAMRIREREGSPVPDTEAQWFRYLDAP